METVSQYGSPFWSQTYSPLRTPRWTGKRHEYLCAAMRCSLEGIFILQCSFDNDYRFIIGNPRGNLVPASDEEAQFVSFAESEFAEAAADGT